MGNEQEQLSFLDDQAEPEPESDAVWLPPPPANLPDSVRGSALDLAVNPHRPYAVAWARVRGVGSARYEKLLTMFGSPVAAWSAPASDLRACLGEEKLVNEIVRQRETIHPEQEMERLEKLKVNALLLADAQYPYLLRQIPAPPFVLFVRGTLLPADEAAIAIVGTRGISTYGKQVTGRFTRDLVAAGMTIVSGLARGVDRVAHSATLEAGGRTFAVLGCGLDLVYPPDHAHLAERIVEQGALISEYPLGVHPDPNNFPARNRIISGLSSAVLVTEAPERSGALITANFACKEHNREVMAVPGNIFSRTSMGCNRLIQDGAHCVMSAQDILDRLNLFLLPQQLTMRELLPADETEATLLRLISDEGSHADDLSRESGLPAAMVSSTLLLMELKGLVRNLGNMLYGKG